MEYVTEKWGGRPHYRGLVHHLGDDEHGAWLWGPVGRTIYRGDVDLFVTEQDALLVVADGAWWAAAWWIGHPELDLYVNINTPAVWEPERIVSVDLDLDVVRFNDGRIEIVDQDEFELHQLQYGYPPECIAGARDAAADVFERISRNEAPFDGLAAQRWAQRGRASAHDGTTRPET